MVKKIMGTTQVQKNMLKRKVRYADEHISAICAKLSNMVINKQTGELAKTADVEVSSARE